MVEGDRRTVMDKALIDYVLIDKRVVGRFVDVHAMRGEGEGVSGFFAVPVKLKVNSE